MGWSPKWLDHPAPVRALSPCDWPPPADVSSFLTLWTGLALLRFLLSNAAWQKRVMSPAQIPALTWNPGSAVGTKPGGSSWRVTGGMWPVRPATPADSQQACDGGRPGGSPQPTRGPCECVSSREQPGLAAARGPAALARSLLSSPDLLLVDLSGGSWHRRVALGVSGDGGPRIAEST